MTREEKLKKICDHSVSGGIMLVERFGRGRMSMMFVCLGCRECVLLPEIIWDKVRGF